MAKVKIFKAIILDRKVITAGAEVELSEEQISRLKPTGVFDDPEMASKAKAKPAQDEAAAKAKAEQEAAAKAKAEQEAAAKAKAGNQTPVRPVQAQGNK